MSTNSNEIAPIPSWTELTNEERCAIIALATSKGINEAARRFKIDTGRSRAYFYAKIYPKIKSFYASLSIGMTEEALRILRGGSIYAAQELVKEIEHKDVRIRNKASNDILEKVLPKTPGVVQQFNVGGGEGTTITFVNFNEPESQ